MKKLLLVGNGMGNINILNLINRKRVKGYRVTLINDERFFIVPGRLSEYIEDVSKFKDVSINLKKMVEMAKGEFIEESIEDIDPKDMTVGTKRGRLAYDKLVIDTNTKLKELAFEKMIDTRKISQLVSFKIDILKDRGASVTILASRVKDAELAMAIRRLSDLRDLKLIIKFVIVDDYYLREVSESTLRLLRRELILHNIDIHDDRDLLGKDKDRLYLEAFSSINSNYILSSLAEENLKILGKGAPLVTDKSFKLRGYNNIYAVGEGVSFNDIPYSRCNYNALEEGEIILNNIINEEKGLEIKNYNPKNINLSLVNLGKNSALIEYNKMNFKGLIAGHLRELAIKRMMENRFLKYMDN